MADKLKTHQHTVPRTLLRGFCDERGFVTMRRRNGLVREIHVDDATVRRGVLHVPRLVGEPSDAVEDWLGAEVESSAGPAEHEQPQHRRGRPENCFTL